MFCGETALNKHKADVHPTVEPVESAEEGSAENDVIEAIAPQKVNTIIYTLISNSLKLIFRF